jgi:hypothetical protein
MADSVDVDGLATRLLELLGKRQPVVEPDDDGRGPPRSVPYHRFRQELEARKAQDAQMAEMMEQIQQLQTGYQSRVTQMQEDAATQVKALGLRHAEDIALMDGGLTDKLGRQTLRNVWETLPQSSRGKSASEWWSGQLDAHRAHMADPEAVAAPDVMGLRPLTPYLPAVEPPPQAETPATNGADAWGRPPAPPTARQSHSIESVPTDQGMEAFYAGLRSLGS